jgi:gas vesicle protein
MPNEQYTQRGDSDFGSKLTYFLIGGSVGAVLALLFAPKSGHELRGDIADATRKGIDRTRETANQLGNRAGEYYEVARDRASDLYATAANRAGELADTARDTATKKKDQLTAAIEAGKQAYEEEKRRAAEPAKSLEPGTPY